jgi:hypothetical protein
MILLVLVFIKGEPYWFKNERSFVSLPFFEEEPVMECLLGQIGLREFGNDGVVRIDDVGDLGFAEL